MSKEHHIPLITSIYNPWSPNFFCNQIWTNIEPKTQNNHIQLYNILKFYTKSLSRHSSTTFQTPTLATNGFLNVWKNEPYIWKKKLFWPTKPRDLNLRPRTDHRSVLSILLINVPCYTKFTHWFCNVVSPVKVEDMDIPSGKSSSWLNIWIDIKPIWPISN